MEFFKGKKREELIKQQHIPLEELNALVFFKIEHENGSGQEIDQVFLEDNPRVSPSEEMYIDAMRKLSGILQENKDKYKKVRHIMKVLYADDSVKDIFSRMGFNIIDISAHALVYNILTLNLKKIKRRAKYMAFINREELLKNFGEDSQEK